MKGAGHLIVWHLASLCSSRMTIAGFEILAAGCKVVNIR